MTLAGPGEAGIEVIEGFTFIAPEDGDDAALVTDEASLGAIWPLDPLTTVEGEGFSL